MLVPTLGVPPPAALDAVVADQRRRPFSYPDVGATAGELPAGYWHGRQSLVVGTGDGAWERAVAGLRRWAAHTGAGVHVHPAGAALEPGVTVAVTPTLGPVATTMACRVVHATAEDGRFGFAYGTLPRHLFEGEERFLLERCAGGDVRFTVVAFLRPRSRLLRAARPVALPLDRAFVPRYLQALRRHVAAT